MQLCGLAVAVFQEISLPIAAHDRAGNVEVDGGNDQFVAQTFGNDELRRMSEFEIQVSTQTRLDSSFMNNSGPMRRKRTTRSRS